MHFKIMVLMMIMMMISHCSRKMDDDDEDDFLRDRYLPTKRPPMQLPR